MIFSKMKHQKEFNLYIKLKIQFLFGYSQNFHHICNAKLLLCTTPKSIRLDAQYEIGLFYVHRSALQIHIRISRSLLT